jgi:hypothetical protein
MVEGSYDVQLETCQQEQQPVKKLIAISISKNAGGHLNTVASSTTGSNLHLAELVLNQR